LAFCPVTQHGVARTGPASSRSETIYPAQNNSDTPAKRHSHKLPDSPVSCVLRRKCLRVHMFVTGEIPSANQSGESAPNSRQPRRTRGDAKSVQQVCFCILHLFHVHSKRFRLFVHCHHLHASSIGRQVKLAARLFEANTSAPSLATHLRFSFSHEMMPSFTPGSQKAVTKQRPDKHHLSFRSAACSRR
jgi:hypothetical protein